MKSLKTTLPKHISTKMRRSQPIILLALILLTGGLLIGCSGASSTQATTPPNPTQANTSSQNDKTGQANDAASNNSAEGNNAGQDNQRGEEEFGLTEAEVIRRVDAVESLIAACMNDAGFEYVPVDYATARKAMDSNSKPSGLNADEFRTQFGYGVTTLFAGAGSQATLGTGEENLRIRAGLSAPDLAAYKHTLYGENPTATFVVGLDSEDFTQTGGCTHAAVEQVFSPAELGPGFVNYQNAQDARVDEDSRVIAANKDWAGCMRQAGYNYSNSDEIKTDLAARLEAITGGAPPDTLPAAAQLALTELQGEEKAIAAADHQCSLEFVDPIKTQIITELFGPAANK